ncbi:MAG: glutamate 5-kinase [Myxococcota bacterium]
MSDDVRVALRDVRRIVVKVGSAALLRDTRLFRPLADEIGALRAQGKHAIVVSSGAIALGIERLSVPRRPTAIARLQAAASAGQTVLMNEWQAAFDASGFTCAQILLTHSDLEDRDRYLNARAALEALLDFGAVPVVNENDSVATDEIRFGDNDVLAAMVATLVHADLLVLLTDVEGVLGDGGVRIPVADGEIESFITDEKSAVGSGGMRSKVDAARRASRSGVPTVIARADPGAVARVVGGKDIGTLFLPQGTRLASRKHWIAFTLRPRGTILVDQGAVAALVEKKRSLLPAGVLGVRGQFEASEPVRIVGPDGVEIGRGLCRYSVADVALLAGARTEQIGDRLGRDGGREIVHRDDLVILDP